MAFTSAKRIVTVMLLLVTAAVVVPAAPSGAAASKVEICHVTNVPNPGDGHIISIADPAFDAHAAHGDKMVGDPGVSVGDDDESCMVSTVPVAVDDAVTTPVDTPVTIDVLANDSYLEPVVVSVQVFPQYGILGIVDVGIFEYTPNAGFIGTDSFVYQICDTAGQCDTATVTITVGP